MSQPIQYARDVMYLDEYRLWELIADSEPFVLRFDDGEMDVTWSSTLISWYLWNIPRRWPDMQLLMKHHLGNNPVSNGIINKIQQRLRESVREAHPDLPINDIYTMYAESINALHNGTVMNGKTYESTADALDLLDIIDHPGIQKALGEFDGTKRGIDKLYKVSEKILATDPELGRSGLVKMHRNGQTKRAQVHQLVLSRGFCSEINQRIFHECVRPSYSQGLKRISDMLMDSRTGSIAQIATTVPVEQSELYNREMQLVSYMVKHIAKADCGTMEGIPWYVQRSDLDSVLVGIYYLTDENRWRSIKKSDSHLVDKIVTIRNPATCMHPDDGVVCRYCVGDAVADIDDKANPGFMLTIEQNQKTTQNTISTKHLLNSAEGEVYVIDPFYQNYIDNEVDAHELVLAEPMWNKGIKLRFRDKDFISVTDISTMPDRAVRNASKVTEIRDMEIVIDHGDGRNPEVVLVPTSKGGFRPYLSGEMIRHMSEHGYDSSEGWITVNMMEWDVNTPLMIFPQRRGSTLELLKDMKTAVFMTDAKSRLKAKRDINDVEVLSDCLREVSEISNRKFTVNLSITSVIMYCMMVRSIRNSDYRLPKPWTLRQFAPQSKIMSGRSISAKLAHSRQYELIPDPRSYINRTRPNHNFDHLVVDIDEWNRKNQEDADRVNLMAKAVQ